MPSFASTSGPAKKVDIPIKNKRYQLPRYPFDFPMKEGQEPTAGAGMLVPWTRVSTLLDTHKDKEGILKWKNRLTAKGLSEREDLIALGAAARLSDKSTLDRVCEQAFDYAKGQASANIGQALHGFLERWLEGDKTLAIPEQWRPDVAAVTAAFQDAGITPVPELQEIVVVRPDLADGDSAGLAGRLDLVVWYEGQLTIADYKTGSDPLLYGAWEIQQQGGIYGSAWAMWDGEFWRPMPPIRRDKMLMIHVLPGAATVTISEIDLDPAELEADIESAYRTRRRRKEAKKAHRLVFKVEDGAVDSMMNTVAQIEDEADRHRAEVHPSAATFNPRRGAPTPEAALQAQKAAERLAKVDAMAKAAGRNDDPDDETAPEIVPDGLAKNELAALAVGGDGKALMPLAGPGERGCGVCGRKGHRKGGKACLGYDDPSFLGKGPLVHPAGGHSWTRDPISGDWSCAVGGEPAAPEVGAVLTGGDLVKLAIAHRAKGEETTGDTAILSGNEAEIRKWWTPNSDPDDSTTEADLAAALHAGELVRGAVADDGRAKAYPQEFPGQVTGAEQGYKPAEYPVGGSFQEDSTEPDPFDEDGSQVLSAKEQDWHLFLDRINEAKDKAEIRAIRAEATELGVWDEALLKAGLDRIKTF